MDNNSNVLNQLELKHILTYENISNIRTYIYKKYSSTYPKKSAAIFANTVNQILDKNLNYFSENNKSRIKKHIYKNTLSKSQFSVSAKDVFQACIDIDEEKETLIKEFNVFSQNLVQETLPDEYFYSKDLGEVSKKHTPITDSISEDLSDPLPDIDYINYLNEVINTQLNTFYALEKESFEAEKLKREQLERENLEKEKLEKGRLEREQLEKENLEKERLEREQLERENLEKEKLERERLEREKLEREKLKREKLKKEKLEKERLEKEKLKIEKLKIEKLKKEMLEREKLEREKLELEKLELEKYKREMLEIEKLEREKLEEEKLEIEKLKKEMLEREKLQIEKLEKEMLEKEKLEREMLEKEKLEREMLEKEKLEREKLEKEMLEKEKLEREMLEKEMLEKEKLERETLEKEMLQKEMLQKEMLQKEKLEKENLDITYTNKNISLYNHNIVCNSDIIKAMYDNNNSEDIFENLIESNETLEFVLKNSKNNLKDFLVKIKSFYQTLELGDKLVFNLKKLKNLNLNINFDKLLKINFNKLLNFFSNIPVLKLKIIFVCLLILLIIIPISFYFTTDGISFTINKNISSDSLNSDSKNIKLPTYDEALQALQKSQPIKR